MSATRTTTRLGSASLQESLAVVGAGVVPALARGLFSPRRKVMKLLTAIDADRRTVGVMRGIRQRHGGDGVKLLGGRLVVLWGEDAIREALDESATVYASDSGAKAKGMGHFQPDALTLSRGEEWEDRRAFTDYVLATKERVHPLADAFREVIADEAHRLHLSGDLSWDDLEKLFDRVTLRVIFGDAARGDQELTALLEKRMGEANRLVGLGPDDEFYELYGRLERYLADPQPGSLLSRIPDAPQTDRTRVVHQIPHWMFATRDTLGMNVARALAIVASDVKIEDRVLEELDEGPDGMRYLEGCLQEAMRLWPTTPLLARETTRDTTLAGEAVDEGTQVLLLNVFNHRNADDVPDADRFRPERWTEGERDYRFNHLSNGRQYCPASNLVLVLGKAVMAELLRRHDLDLREPELDPSGDMPYMLDVFAVRMAARPRQ